MRWYDGGNVPSRGASRAGQLIVWLGLLSAAALAASIASAELGLAVSVEEGLSIMGGPLAPHMARPEEEAEPDQVTAASVDAITGASRLASSGGAQVHLSRRGLGSLSLGLEYVHYRFALDYEPGRADLTVLGLRALAMARLPLLVLWGAPAVTFGFGGYLELLLYDEAELAGAWVDLELRTAAAGLAFDFHVHPFRLALPGERGHLVPGLYARAYRGLLPQLVDERGSEAPLANIALGLEVRWELPAPWVPAPGPAASGRRP
jgi:hypothetical protein